ncbi:MAG: threonylcarbamoyl-AMP synthase [Burkholderiales bacterium]|nr:threonylcarbamoyl-AMP synthase [Burkholderiales bacterium]
MAIVPGTDPAALRDAAARLAAGELVAFPTETVYGLGARADDDAAVARIYAAKGRPSDHPLIVHLADAAAADAYAATIAAPARRLMDAFWPGPLTLIVPRREDCGRAAAAGQSTIGLRVPAHPVALALLREAAQHGVSGVAGPSANRHGRVSPTSAAHVEAEFGPGLTVVDGGNCAVGIESAIVDCSRGQPALLRPGQIGRAAIEAVLGQALAAPDAASPRAPGTLASHYAPAARVELLDTVALRHRLEHPAALGGARVGVYSRLALAPGEPGLAGSGWVVRVMPDDAAAAAHELFAVLRGFDEAGVAAIWVESPPPGPAWDGVRDRLQRAAA